MVFGGFEFYFQITIFIVLTILFSAFWYFDTLFSPILLNGKQKVILWLIKCFFHVAYITNILMNNNENKDYDLIEFFDECRKLKHYAIYRWTDFKLIMLSITDKQFFSEHISVDDRFTHWNSASNFFILKLNFIFYIFSFDSIFIHHLYGTFLFFSCLMLSFKMLESMVQCNFRHYIILSCIPFFSYYTVGISKDTLFFCALSLLFYVWHLQNYRLAFKCIISIIILIFSIQFRASWIIILLVSFVVALIYNIKNIKHKNYLYITVLAAIALVAFNYNFLIEILQQKQLEFSAIVGSSTLEPLSTNFNILTILYNIPHAIWRTILCDFPKNISISIFIALIESILLFLFILYFKQKSNIRNNIKHSTLIFFSIISIIIIGLTVNNCGAIVRYRSLFYFIIMYFFMIKYLPQNNNTCKI
jgi:hypothetical protein